MVLASVSVLSLDLKLLMILLGEERRIKLLLKSCFFLDLLIVTIVINLIMLTCEILTQSYGLFLLFFC